MNRINLVILLDRLEELLTDSPRIPVTGRSAVDVDEAIELIQKIRATIPEEIKRAERISGDRDRVMQASKQKAEKIVTQAEEYAKRLVEESSIVKDARAEADKIIADARKRADELEEGATEYAQQVLDNLENYLKDTLKVVGNGKKALTQDQPH